MSGVLRSGWEWVWSCVSLCAHVCPVDDKRLIVLRE